MAMQHLSQDREFRYIICWFTEFSELQREDFLPILVDYLSPKMIANGNGHINGLVNAFDSSSITNKPMSLFQCRIKLFREWSAKWPLDYKRKLQDRIIEIDPKVGEKLMSEIGLSNGSAIVENGVDAENVTAALNDDIVNAAVALVNATEEAIISDNRLAAMLNNEASVDDDSNDTDATSHAIEPAGQVQTHVVQPSQEPQQLVISTQTSVLNNNAEVPLVV